jgi:ABC-type Mn2+/Zn2+ transport system permease subunit
MKALTDLFTGIDGQTHDLGRWSWASCHVSANVATIGLFLIGHAPTIMEFAGAHAAIAGAHAGALFVKQQTEPK